MKIKLSKSDWELIGNKTGWMKTATVSENVVPVDQILGTSPTGNETQIDEEMHSKGYFLFREHYYFGKMLSYQNKKGDKIYLLNGNKWSTWEQVKQEMKDTWRPTGTEEIAWYHQNIA